MKSIKELKNQPRDKLAEYRAILTTSKQHYLRKLREINHEINLIDNVKENNKEVQYDV